MDSSTASGVSFSQSNIKSSVVYDTIIQINYTLFDTNQQMFGQISLEAI
jgi:hypothetical protein